MLTVPSRCSAVRLSWTFCRAARGGSARLGVFREAPESRVSVAHSAPQLAEGLAATRGLHPRRAFGSLSRGAPPLPRPARWRLRAAHVTARRPRLPGGGLRVGLAQGCPLGWPGGVRGPVQSHAGGAVRERRGVVQVAALGLIF